MQTFYIPEPNLFFRDGKTCIDPKVGLLNFGPNGLPEENFEITIGLVGSRVSNLHAKQFLDRLQYHITGEKQEASNIRGIDFPGVDTNLPLGFYFTVREEFCETISDDILVAMTGNTTRADKIVEAADAFQQALHDLSGIHPGPNLVLISLPQEIITACKEPLLRLDNIKLSGRTYQELRRIARMPPEDRPPLIDFHHYLKVVSFEYNLKTQIIKPRTLNFSSDIEDPATIAWNFVAACYYKSTGTPWKLADLEPETIHVGISFYNDLGTSEIPVVRAAIAQVYMKTGESQVIRGLEIPITEEEAEDRTTNLTSDQAHDILDQAIALYRRQHDQRDPIRVVVHKKSQFTNEELAGFERAAKGIPIQDYLHIMEFPDLRVLTPGDYPIARGSVFHHKINQKPEFFIYTIGYIPALATYPGFRVPRPLQIRVEKADSLLETLATDIMNLTKLDWNSTHFAKRMPVTISVSQKVGEIMGEIAVTTRRIEIPSAYAYYM